MYFLRQIKPLAIIFIIFFMYSIAYSNDELSDVVATGMGIDSDSALKNALLNAVNQSIGMLVDAETLVKNDNIVKDEILTHSDGYVDTFNKISECKRDDGLFEIKIKATVKRMKVVEKLKNNNISIMSIDGNSIFGEALTKQESLKSAEEMFKKSFDGIPASLFDAELLDEKPSQTLIKKEENIVEASWKVKISYNIEKYYKILCLC